MKRFLPFLLTVVLTVFNLSNYDVVNAEELTIYSDYYLLIDRDNGQVIMENGSDDKIYPASMTKMMTLIVGLENIDDTSLTIKLDSEIYDGLLEANASMAGFYLDEVVSLEDCLYGLFLPSGAETTRAVAHHVAGSEEAFVELMNQKAQELNLENTNFVNTTGLHDIDHYTTLNDLAVLMEYCLLNPEFKEIFSTRKYTAMSGSMHSLGLTWQSNMFASIERVGWNGLDESTILGGKTGYTIPAGLCLASTASQDNRNYLLVTSYAPVGSTPYHVVDAVNIYSDIYNNYTKSELINTENVLGEIDLRFKLFQDTVTYSASETVELTLPNEVDVEKISVQTELVESVDAPITKGQVFGTATLVYEDEILYSFDVVAQEDISRSNILYYSYVIGTWMMNNLIWTGVIVFVIGFVLWRCYVHRYELKKTRRKIKRSKKYHR